MRDTLVIIPTYNEKENIDKIIFEIFALYPDISILVVDDNSPDKTAQIVENLQLQFANLFLLNRPQKEGLGKAYLAGFAWALQRHYQYILEMDADFSHPVSKIKTLKETVENKGGIAIGSRYIKEGNIQGWDYKRVILSKGAAYYVRLLLNLPVADPTAGFICYHRKVLETIPLNQISLVGYGFQIAMKYYSYKLGFPVQEVPISFIDRVRGKSKMSMSIFKEAVVGILQLRKIVFMGLFLFLSACDIQFKDPRSFNVDKDKMIDILYDLHLFEEYAKASILKDSLSSEYQKNQQMIIEYQSIFTKHEINQAIFKENFDYYSANNLGMKSIYEKLNEKYLIDPNISEEKKQ